MKQIVGGVEYGEYDMDAADGSFRQFKKLMTENAPLC